MSNFTLDPSCCRIDVWRLSGKWYITDIVVFRSKDYNETLIHEAFRNAINYFLEGRYKGMIITCL